MAMKVVQFEWTIQPHGKSIVHLPQPAVGF